MGIKLWFSKRQTDVPTSFVERLELLEAIVSKLKRESVNNTLDIETMRDKVLRKIQKKRNGQDETEDNPPPLQDAFESVRKIGKEGTK